MDIKLSITIMAHPKRKEWVKYLLNNLNGEVKVIWDEKNNVWDTARRSWLSYDPNCSHHLVIQDDVIVSLNLRSAAEKLIKEVPDEIITLSTINYRLNSQERETYKKLYREGVRWYKNTKVLTAPAIIVPTKYIEDMVYACDFFNSPHDDVRIRQYCNIHQAEVHHTVPSLVEHRSTEENKSLVKGNDKNRGTRQVVIFIGEDKSGLDLDWKKFD